MSERPPEADESPSGTNRSASALHTSKGTPSQSSINPNLKRTRSSARAPLTTEAYVEGILAADRTILSRAITLVESARHEHQEQAQEIVQACLYHAGDSIRVGITGVPGVGKSTFIEALGQQLLRKDHRIAVLAIDPSSTRTKGSILGDKTRMGELSKSDRAFIRPSPTSGSLGGVARKTRETIVLCEAAGFDTILVETVGVGQSETTVRSMVDFFLLLALAGAGDELQGIKRGIVEMADAVVINKAEEHNQQAVERAKRDFENALHLFPTGDSGWSPPVLACSALTGYNIDTVWNAVMDYREATQGSGFFYEQRRRQARFWMHQTIEQRLLNDFMANEAVQDQLDEVEQAVVEGSLSPFAAAERLLNAYRSRSTS